MLKKVKHTIKHTSIYGIGNIATKLIGIVLLPLYTDKISTHDFGVYARFEILMQILPILALGLPMALQRWLGLKEFRNKQGGLLFSAWSFVGVYVLILFSGLYFVAEPLTILISDSAQYTPVLLIILAVTWMQLLNRITLVKVRMDERSVFFSITNTIKIAVQLGVIVYLIAVREIGFIGIFWGELVGSALLFVLLFPYLAGNIRFKLELAELKAMLRFSVPAVFGNFTSQLVNYSDRNWLAFFVNDAVLGIYVLGYKVANVLGAFLINAFNIAFPAIAWPQVGKSTQNRFFSKNLTYFAFVLIWASLFLVTFAKGIIHRFAQSKDYWDASVIIPFAVLGLFFYGINVIINYGLLVSKKTERISMITALALAANCGFNILLVPYFSLVGTAIANLLTYVFRFSLTYFWSRKLFPITWEFGKIAKLILVACALYFLTLLFDDLSLLWRIVTKSAIVFSLPIWLYFLNFYEQIEIDTLRSFITNRHKPVENP